MENRPRDERAHEDATAVSSELQRLFEESSFGSPQAQQAYTPPPPHLVPDIVHQVRTIIAVDIEDSTTPLVIDGHHRQQALRRMLEEHCHQDLSHPLPTGKWQAKQVLYPISDQDLDVVRALGDDLTGFPDRDATRLCLHNWPRPREQPVEDLTTRLGQQAYDLAREYLAVGNLDRAAHWLTVASEYNIPDAQRLLADIAAVRHAWDDEDTPRQATQTDGHTDGQPDGQPDIVDQIHELADLLRRAREKAQAIVDEAHTTAEEILTEARQEAATPARAILTDHLGQRMVVTGTSDGTVRLWDLATGRVVSSIPTRGERLLDILVRDIDGADSGIDRLRARYEEIMKTLGEDVHTCAPSSTTRRRYARVTQCQAELPADLLYRHLLQVWASGEHPTGELREPGVSALIAAPPLVTPRLWTPPPLSPQRARDDDKASTDDERLEREQIVAGPKFRQALDDLNQQLVATGT